MLRLLFSLRAGFLSLKMRRSSPQRLSRCKLTQFQRIGFVFCILGCSLHLSNFRTLMQPLADSPADCPIQCNNKSYNEASCPLGPLRLSTDWWRIILVVYD